MQFSIDIFAIITIKQFLIIPFYSYANPRSIIRENFLAIQWLAMLFVPKNSVETWKRSTNCAKSDAERIWFFANIDDLYINEFFQQKESFQFTLERL